MTATVTVNHGYFRPSHGYHFFGFFTDVKMAQMGAFAPFMGALEIGAKI